VIYSDEINQIKLTYDAVSNVMDYPTSKDVTSVMHGQKPTKKLKNLRHIYEPVNGQEENTKPQNILAIVNGYVSASKDEDVSIFHISFISFSQSLWVNEPSDIEHVTVSAFTAISQGKQSSCINIRGVDRSQSSRIPAAIWLTFREQS
jgi:hypothetical protein